MKSQKDISVGFRNFKEVNECYNKFHCTAFVSKGVKDAFLEQCNYAGPAYVMYNTIESDVILTKSKEKTKSLAEDKLKLISVGTLKRIKGYDRLLRIVKRLNDEGMNFHLYVMGRGPMQNEMEEYIKNHNLGDIVTMLGYDTNPYKFISKCDLFLCSSYAEGFSTAATEALIVGTPVCTVEVSGMKEMLGENNEYGIVTDNDEDALYKGIKSLLDNPDLLAHYKSKALERGKRFSTENTVKAVEEMLLSL